MKSHLSDFLPNAGLFHPPTALEQKFVCWAIAFYNETMASNASL